MKIAAIALASALASLAFAQPSWAQQNDHDQIGQMQYGPGHDQFRDGMRRDRDTYGQGENWHHDGDWRGGDNHGQRGWHHDEDRMEGRMGMGGMNPHVRGRFAQEQGATFVFGNGRARMAVHCPANESVETCVRAASQLLDKIGSLRSGADTGPSGGNTGSSSSSDDSSGTGHPQLNGGSGALQQEQD
jgi:hypothetical protein